MTLEEVISKYKRQKEMWERVAKDSLMYEKKDREKAANYVIAFCTVLEDLEKIECRDFEGVDNCDCTHTQACKICAKSKDIDWDDNWDK